MKKFDVIVVGAGGAGCSAAIEAKLNNSDVCIICKSLKIQNKTFRAQGGIQAAFGKDDSELNHYNDTIKAGIVNKKKLVNILVKNAKEAVLWLEKLGVKFDKKNGNYVLKKGAGMSHPRILSCGDTTGNRIIEPLHKKVTDLNIPIFENLTISDIEKNKNNLFICKAKNTNNKVYKFSCKSLVLATGGDIGKEKKSGIIKQNDDYDGKQLSKKLGLVYKKQDLRQYHPLGVLDPSKLKRSVIPESIRFDGARLLNKNNKEFIKKNSLRGEVTKAIIKECKNGLGIKTSSGYYGVWLTTSEIERKKYKGFIKEKYPSLWRNFLRINWDPSVKNILVYPVLHYNLGGIDINQEAQTNIKGVYAAGEATWGVHGQERIMGNSLTDIFVFGRIAGRNASKYAKKNK